MIKGEKKSRGVTRLILTVRRIVPFVNVYHIQVDNTVHAEYTHDIHEHTVTHRIYMLVGKYYNSMFWASSSDRSLISLALELDSSSSPRNASSVAYF